MADNFLLINMLSVINRYFW